MSRKSSISISVHSSTLSLNSDVSEAINLDGQRHRLKLNELDNEYILKICEALDWDPNDDEQRSIAQKLLIYGRQALIEHKDDIVPVNFEEQMQNDGSSKLLQILKEYYQHLWQQIPFDWFDDFLTSCSTKDDDDEYQRVLTRAAEYGSKFLKDYPIFSIVLQIIFEFDNETIADGVVFEAVWNSFIKNGRQEALIQSEEHIVPEVMQQHMNDPKSPLFLALRECFRRPVMDLFQQCSIDDRRNLLEVTLDCLANSGWKSGLNDTKVKQLIKPRNYLMLLEKGKEFLGPEVLTPTPRPPVESTEPPIRPEDLSIIPTSEVFYIQQCIKLNEKIDLSALTQAGELLYMGKRLNEVAAEIVNKFPPTHNFPNFMQESLVTIMYLLKRHQSLNDFFEYLTNNYFQAIGFSMSINLRSMIHILLMNSNKSVSRMIMTLLCKRNPVPFLEPTFDENPHPFVAEIVHVWNYSLPTILSFGIGPCPGKSSLLNTLFLSTFEKTVQSIYFQQTIDIDFGYNFQPPRSINIADTHGEMTKQLLYKIHNLFDAFIIQIEGTFLNKNFDLLFELLQILPNDKFRLILVREVANEMQPQCMQLLQAKGLQQLGNVRIFILPNILDKENSQNRISLRQLRDLIIQNAPNHCTYNRDYLTYEIKRLIDSNARLHLDNISRTIEPLQTELRRAADDTNDQSNYFPIYNKFVELCNQRQKSALLSFYDSTNEEIYRIRIIIHELEHELEHIGPGRNGRIFDLFLKVLQSPETMIILDILTNVLRQERSQLISTSEMADKLSVEKSLSLEVLWRNVIVCYPYQTKDIQRLICDKYAEYMMAGYPFEIIDGDNFHFASEFLLEALRAFQGKRILVISIIGPQNSGKSTLLNYMFGTWFDVRDGRCTRGIYGSFVKANSADFDYIMLIDTEGLMGIERGEKKFDRRLVLFCLAVSHLVIVNTLGEINDVLKDMFTLCADTLRHIGVNTIPQPKIHFVLNQRADLNIENNQTAINKIVADMTDYDLRQMIDIRQDTFHALPCAFKKERSLNDTRMPSVIRTEPEFIECVQHLCDVIIRSGTESLTRNRDSSLDPLQWNNFASNIFDTLQTFSDLTYFRDVNERQQDIKVREHIQNEMARVFSSEYKEQLTKEAANHTENEIRDLFDTKEVRISEDMRQRLENTLTLLKASDTIRERSRRFLKAQITEMFRALHTSAEMETERERMTQLVRNGEGELKNLIERTITNGGITNEKSAQQKFTSMYEDIVLRIEQRFNPVERSHQAMHFIYINYNIYEYSFLLNSSIFDSRYAVWSNELNRIPINDAVEDIQCRFTYFTYEHPCIEEQPFNPDIYNPYSLDIINSLVYLNKNALRQLFRDYCNNQNIFNGNSNQRAGKQNSDKNGLYDRAKSAINRTKEVVGLGKKHGVPSITTNNFQKQIRDLIIRQKPNGTSKDIVTDNDVLLGVSNYFETMGKYIISVLHNRQIDTNLIQRIVGTIHTIIKDINLELSPFNLAISSHVKSMLHSCAVMILARSYYDEQEKHFQDTLETLKDRKEAMCNYFVSMVVPDISCDAHSGVCLIDQLNKQILKDFSTEAQEIISVEINQCDHINRRWIQERCDGKLYTERDSWLLDYIENPNKIIEDFFADMWGDIRDQINRRLEARKLTYGAIIGDFFHCINAVFNALKTQGIQPTTFVDLTFQSEARNTFSVNENLKNKNRCMAMLLFTYLSGDPIEKTISMYGTVYNIKADIHGMFTTLSMHTPPSPGLIETTKAMFPVYDSTSIANLAAFLEMLLDDKHHLIRSFNKYSADFDALDTRDTYNRLLDKVRGCSERCPCCRRPCDADHTLIKSMPGSEDNQHCCALGHALRGMNGYRYETTNEASLAMCEQIKSEQVIIVGSTRKRWSEFKNDHKDWYFDPIMSIDDINHLHGKFLTVWSRIGQGLCLNYGMKFVMANTLRPIEHMSYHYILLLDGSGSMAGKAWQDLLSGVREFVGYRLSIDSNDRFSIIIFSTHANLVYFNQEADYVDLSMAKFPGAQTNFAEAFSTVHSVITQAEQNPSNNTTTTTNTNHKLRYSIIFMSDGDGDYPDRELTRLLENYRPLIERFWTVSLGQTKMETLEHINQTMGGEFLNIEDSQDLIDTYAEIARN